MSRKNEINKLEKRLRLLKSEEILMDRILEDTVERIKDVVNPKFKSKNKLTVRNKVKYRLVAKREGTTITCTITDTLGLKVLGVGVARCHINDEFDDKIGFAIAQMRAKADCSNRSADSIIKRMTK